jgi:hypothetical protein
MTHANSNPELSANAVHALQERFAGAERNEVASLLREFHWKLQPGLDERVHLNILHAASDLDQVRKLVTIAKKDWRDLILATEYELRDGKTGANGMVKRDGEETRSAAKRRALLKAGTCQTQPRNE